MSTTTVFKNTLLAAADVVSLSLHNGDPGGPFPFTSWAAALLHGSG